MFRRRGKHGKRKRGKRAAGGWRAWLNPPPPPSTLECFPVRSVRHLTWLTRRKGRHFFLLYEGRHCAPLSIWWEKGGFHVCCERSARQQFIPHGRFAASPCGRALAAGRLYVRWDI